MLGNTNVTTSVPRVASSFTIASARALTRAHKHTHVLLIGSFAYVVTWLACKEGIGVRLDARARVRGVI